MKTRFSLAMALSLSVLALGCAQSSNVPSVVSPVTSRPPTIKGPAGKTPIVPGANATETLGGVDGGGGTGTFSTPAEVREAIALAMKLATHKDYRRNIFKRFVVEGTQRDIRGEENFKVDVGRMFPAIDDVSGSVIRWDQTDLEAKLKSPAIDYLRTLTPAILDDKYCPAPDKDHAEASVTKFDMTAKLCFSVKALVRIPNTTLLKEVLALLMHETVHMTGGDEKLANEWQGVFDTYFSRTYGYIQERDLRDEHGSVFMKLLVMNLATGMGYVERGEDEKAATMMAVMATELASLPLLFDPIAMELGIRPKNPELVNNYVNSVLATMEIGWKPTGFTEMIRPEEKSEEQMNQDLADEFNGKKKPYEKKKIFRGEELKAIYEKFSDMFLVVAGNYAAYAKGDQKSVCLLPADKKPNFGAYRSADEDGHTVGPSTIPEFACDAGTLPWDGKTPGPGGSK